MQHAMTTTAFTLDGYRITKTLGESDTMRRN